MAKPTIAPYGAWKSPVTAGLLVGGMIGLAEIVLDGDDVYWLEGRPTEGGRNVVVRRDAGGHTVDITPATFNVRTRVHEYGGGAYTVVDGVVYFANFADQRVYRQAAGAAPAGGPPERSAPAGATPAALTPSGVDMRYADFVFDRRRNRLICVREEHTPDGQVINTLAGLPLGEMSTGGEEGGGAGRATLDLQPPAHDFFSSPRLSPDGSRLAWLCWNHPNMPWDSTELWLAGLDREGRLADARPVAGGLEAASPEAGRPLESIFQPEWSPDGNLYFVSDRTGWWNLYCLTADGDEAIFPMAAEFGLPQWVFGMATYGFESAERLVCLYNERNVWTMGVLTLGPGSAVAGQSAAAQSAAPDGSTLAAMQPLDLPFVSLASLAVAPGRVYCLAGSSSEPEVLVQVDLATQAVTVLRSSSSLQIDRGYISVAQDIDFPTTGGLTAHAFLYSPKNRDYLAPPDELPPLLVLSHGGPTAGSDAALSLGLQFWTSRGFAVLDVNYGGSTGYGRDYRARLDGQWGIVDVDDCVNGALYLAEQGLVDRNRLAIRGGSAGGYTTLAALTFHDVFRAGASHYGIGDLETLATDTHKFESRYLDRLVGPYPAARAVYLARSPIYHVDRLATPVILLQGLEDRVVPPAQAESMFAALKAKGIPVAYLPFPGEQHGFRKAENIQRALEAELYFYSKIFGFALAEPVEPVKIENL
jgi:dipeptidyl aminopeptidase/acylaminoacyl peptidase